MQQLQFDNSWQVMQGAGFLFGLDSQCETINLPHDGLIGRERRVDAKSGPSTGFVPGCALTYKKTFHVPAAWQGRHIELDFEGVYMNAEIRVNNNLVFLHPYGYTGFSVDLTNHLDYGSDNTISVVTRNDAEPNSRWYTGVGIYRHVWLLVSEPVYIKPWSLRITTPQVSPEQATIHAAVVVVNDSPIASDIEVIFAIKGEKIASSRTVHLDPAQQINVETELIVENPRLWSDETPDLYAMDCQIQTPSGMADLDSSTFGIRKIEFSPSFGFKLNGIVKKLKGGCIHHDNGPLGAAAFDRAEERKLELLKAAGYNAIRSSHNPPSPKLMAVCDRLGLMLINESFDCWRSGKSAYDYHVWFEDWWQRDLESMVSRGFNHPSVIIWSYGNEIVERDGNSDGYAWSRKLADYLRVLDPTRPTNGAICALASDLLPPQKLENNDAIGPADKASDYVLDAILGKPVDSDNDQWGNLTEKFAEPMDIVGYNYLVHRYGYDLNRFPDRVILGTETFPHEIYHYWTETLKYPNVIGDFVWTAFDYLGEGGIGRVVYDQPIKFTADFPWFHSNCGDFDICGFKRPQSYFKDILWGIRNDPYIAVFPPEIHGRKIDFSPWGWEPVIASWTFHGQENKPCQIEVYCANDEVELLINGVSQGRKQSGASVQNKTKYDVIYHPGIIEAIGYQDGNACGSVCLQTAGQPLALRLSADRTNLSEKYSDLSYLTVEAIDQNGLMVNGYDFDIEFSVQGPAELAAVGNGNPISLESFTSCHRRLFQGKALAIIRSVGQKGVAMVRARSADLAEATIEIQIGLRIE